MPGEAETNKSDEETNDAMKVKCPYCLSEVAPDAHRCRHCLVDIEGGMPDHDGVCPLCKESIDPDASRCKWCKSWLVPPAVFRFPDDEMNPVNHMDLEFTESPPMQNRAMPTDPIFTEPWWQGMEPPPPKPPAPIWHCRYVDDWSTFDFRSKTLWVFEECKDVLNGGNRRRRSHPRRVTQREYDRWKAINI